MRKGIHLLLFGWILGGSFVGRSVWNVVSTADLADVGERAVVVEVVSANKQTYASYVDRTGRERRCGSGELQVGDTVVYDASRCRGLQHVGVPTLFEAIFFLAGAGLILLGTLAAVERRPDAPSQEGLPHGVRREEGDGILLTLPWRHETSVAGVVLLMFFVGLSALFAVGLLLPALVVPAWLLYNQLYSLVNETTVHIRDDRVTITHGPLPSPNWGMEVPLTELRDLRVVPRHQGRHTTYALTAGSRELLHHWNDEATLAYVRRCLLQARGGRP